MLNLNGRHPNKNGMLTDMKVEYLKGVFRKPWSPASYRRQNGYIERKTGGIICVKAHRGQEFIGFKRVQDSKELMHVVG